MLRRTAFTAVTTAALLALTLTGCSGSGNAGAVDNNQSAPGSSDAGTTTTEAPAEAPAEPSAVGLNTPLTLGTFEYTVTGIEELGTTLGEEPLSTTAQGTFLKIDLSVKNVGDKSETFFDSYVALIDAEGKQFAADSMAPIYLQSDTSWVSGINPGNTMAGPVVFDVPAGTVAEYLMVKENMFIDKGELIALK